MIILALIAVATALLGALPVWVPRTVSQPLISLFVAGRPRGHGPQPAQHDPPLWLSDSPI